MFTRDDFIAYFSEMQMMEKNMRDIYAEAVSSVSDAEIKKIFGGLVKAENMHENLVDELRRLVIRGTM